MVKLPEGKMASRRGNVITAEWLLAEVKKRLQERYPMPEEIAEKVAQGAVKYAFLKSSIGQDIAFSFDESISLEGNSGPYLQYTFARTQSVLAKVKNQKKAVNNAKLVLNTEETRLLRSLFRFPETIATAAKTYSPNLLCNYLYDLAKDFNGFYNQYRILKSDNVDFRLLLTTGVGQVLKNGLNLLGIQAPEKM
jgi:arginyl-tRNA synthetase